MHQARHMRYLEIVKLLNERSGDATKGETVVITDITEIMRMEAILQDGYEKKGLPREYGNLGVVFEDPWYVAMKEPVYFGKTPGSYWRVLFKGELSGQKSIFCLPMSHEGNFIMTVSYRTTTRDWVIEAPGTATKEGELHHDALMRSVREKLGYSEIASIIPLSPAGIISERGIMGAAVPMYQLIIDTRQTQTRPTDLNVRHVVEIDRETLECGFLTGTIDICGHTCLCQDGYTASALLMQALRNKYNVLNMLRCAEHAVLKAA